MGTFCSQNRVVAHFELLADVRLTHFHHRGCFWLLLSNKSNSVSKIFERSLQCFRYLLCRQKVAPKTLRKARISGSSVIFA